MRSTIPNVYIHVCNQILWHDYFINLDKHHPCIWLHFIRVLWILYYLIRQQFAIPRIFMVKIYYNSHNWNVRLWFLFTFTSNCQVFGFLSYFLKIVHLCQFLYYLFFWGIANNYLHFLYEKDMDTLVEVLPKVFKYVIMDHLLFRLNEETNNKTKSCETLDILP